jgi:hypothetical protein
MGRIAKLLSFVREVRNGAKVSDSKVDPGGGANITAQHFAAAGDDSHPMPGDYVALNTDSGSGRESAVGYLDPLNAPKALTGDRRIYARSASGALVVEVWLKNTGEATILNANGSVTLRQDGGTITTTPGSTFDAKADGSIKGDNGSGSFELEAGGDFLVNGVIIDTSGNITSPATITAPNVAGASSVTAAGKELLNHRHSQPDDSGGNTESDTGPNN